MTSGLLNHKGRALLALLVAMAPLLLLPAAPPAPPAPPAKEAGKRVRLSLVVIVASETDATVDRRLACIAEVVKKRHPELKGFKVAKLCFKSLPAGSCEAFELVDGEVATVAVQCCGDKKGRVRLKVGPPAMGEITYVTPCGKFLPIVTPIRTRKNELLILGIRVQPCKGK